MRRFYPLLLLPVVHRLSRCSRSAVLAVAVLPVKPQGAAVLSLHSLLVLRCRGGLVALPVCLCAHGLYRGRLLASVRHSRLSRSLPLPHHKHGLVLVFGVHAVQARGPLSQLLHRVACLSLCFLLTNHFNCRRSRCLAHGFVLALASGRKAGGSFLLNLCWCNCYA